MTDEIIVAVAQSIFIALFVYYVQRKQNTTDKKSEARENARHKESLLLLELNMASAKLSYAVAMAIKRGTPNGEVEDGVRAYEQAKEKYYHFLNEQAKEYLD